MARSSQGFMSLALVLGSIGMIVFTVFMALIAAAFYVFTSLMLYKLAKKRGTPNAWLAWIPLGNLYILGDTCGEMMLFGKLKIDKTGLYLLLVPIAAWIVTTILGILTTLPFIGVLFSVILKIFNILWMIAFAVFYLCVLYRIYSSYLPKETVLVYTLVSIINVTQPFFFCSLLKKEPICSGYDFTF